MRFVRTIQGCNLEILLVQCKCNCNNSACVIVDYIFILPLKLSLKRTATAAEWWVGPEFQKDIPFHSCCHFVLVVLVEWVSCNNLMWIFLVFRLLKSFIILLCLLRPFTLTVRTLNLWVWMLCVCVVHFRVYVSRESNVESLCLVRLVFNF